jgi:ATP-dependent DNA helicase RecQ
VRWRQYRAIWGFVEQRRCRREALLRHFGDRAAPRTDPGVICCDVCDPAIAPRPATVGRVWTEASADDHELDAAIVAVVTAARPPVGRTRAVEILRGSRTQAIREHAYDGLPAYGGFAHLRGEQVLQRIDMLIARGTLRSSGGRYPTLHGTVGRA